MSLPAYSIPNGTNGTPSWALIIFSRREFGFMRIWPICLLCLVPSGCMTIVSPFFSWLIAFSVVASFIACACSLVIFPFLRSFGLATSMPP